MQTKSIVQTSANVIRITNLGIGDLYKRFDDSSYSRSTYYGIVRNIYNDGEKTYVEATEYKYSYGDISAELYVIRGDLDVSIFPANIEEIEKEFANAKSSLAKKINEKHEEIAKLEKALSTTEALLSGTLQAELRTPIFKEMTQAEYNEILRQREQLALN